MQCRAVGARFCVDEPGAAPESDRRVSTQYSMAAVAGGGGGGGGDLGRLATGHGCGRVSGGSGSEQGWPGLACRPASGHHTGPVTGPACTTGPGGVHGPQTGGTAAESAGSDGPGHFWTAPRRRVAARPSVAAGGGFDRVIRAEPAWMDTGTWMISESYVQNEREKWTRARQRELQGRLSEGRV